MSGARQLGGLQFQYTGLMMSLAYLTGRLAYSSQPQCTCCLVGARISPRCLIACEPQPCFEQPCSSNPDSTDDQFRILHLKQPIAREDPERIVLHSIHLHQRDVYAIRQCHAARTTTHLYRDSSNLSTLSKRRRSVHRLDTDHVTDVRLRLKCMLLCCDRCFEVEKD